jgi:uncharacterized protein (TIGR03085 family)
VSHYAQDERARLVRAMEAAGPDAPTLCEGWTVRDLAAHLVVRERRPDAGPGLLVPALAGWTERVRRDYARRDFAELVRLVRTGPGRLSPFALPAFGEAANLAEHYVHAEDVLRAPPRWSPWQPPDGLADALWALASRRGMAMFRRSPVGVVLVEDGGRRSVVVPRSPAVVLTGGPGELVLYAYGRTAHALVDVSGPPEAVEQFGRTDLSV